MPGRPSQRETALQGRHMPSACPCLPKREDPLARDPRLLEAATSSHSLRSRHSLLHDEEESPPVAQACGVKTRGQHVRVVDQGPWQQRHRRGEGSQDPDDVGVRGQLLGTSLGSSVSAGWDKHEGAADMTLGIQQSEATINTDIHLHPYLYQVCARCRAGCWKGNHGDSSHW